MSRARATVGVGVGVGVRVKHSARVRVRLRVSGRVRVTHAHFTTRVRRRGGRVGLPLGNVEGGAAHYAVVWPLPQRRRRMPCQR